MEIRTFINRNFNNDKKVSNQPSKQGDLYADKSTESKEEPVSSNLKTLNDIDYDYQLVDTEEKMNELCGKIFTSSAVSVDTETTSTDAMKAELVGLSFSIEENKAFYVPIPSEREEALKIVNIFKGVYESPDLMKIGQNIKYDIIVLANYGVKFNGPIFDTMIAHYVLQPELRHNMDYMAEVYLNYKTIHIDELIGPKGKGQKNMRSLSPSEVYKYASEDADVTLKLKNIFEVELKKNGLYSLFEEIEMPLVPVLARMEMNGVRVDTESLAETSRQFAERMSTIEKEIHEMAGMDFNISSPKQVGEVLFDKLKIVDKAKKTKTGQYVTSEDVLQNLKSRHPIVEKILDYRGYKTTAYKSKDRTYTYVL